MTDLVTNSTSVQLTIAEQAELIQCERTIEHGLRTFVEVGNALLSIRDKRLYRAEYSTWEDYCQERWGFQRHRANRLIAAAETVNNLVPIGTIPQNEAQARPLTRLEPEQQREAWTQVVAENPDSEITGAKVQEVVDQIAGSGCRIVKCPTCGNLYDKGTFGNGCPYCYKASRGLRGWVDGLPEMMRQAAKSSSDMAVHFSSETPEHYTPQEIIAATLDCLGQIDLDPCSNSHDNPNVPAVQHFTQEDDGLAQEWHGRVYMNPPYGRAIGDWVEKLCIEHEVGRAAEAVALVPSRTDTQWWLRLRDYPVCFIQGRLTFVGSEDPAPFPSAVFYLGENLGVFFRAFYELGDCWQRMMPGILFGE